MNYSLIKDFSHWKIREYALLFALLVIQTIAYMVSPTNIFSLFGTLCGATCVVLIAKGKISNYLFGFISSVIIFALAIQAKVYAEMPLQIFYIIVDIVSVIVWFKASSDHTGEVKKARALHGIERTYPVFLWAFFSLVAFYIVYFLGDSQPILDAATFGMGATAMILLLYRFRENFVIWFLTNLLSIVLWFKAGLSTANYTVFVMYVLYLLNSINGIYLWYRKNGIN